MLWVVLLISVTLMCSAYPLFRARLKLNQRRKRSLHEEADGVRPYWGSTRGFKAVGFLAASIVYLGFWESEARLESDVATLRQQAGVLELEAGALRAESRDWRDAAVTSVLMDKGEALHHLLSATDELMNEPELVVEEYSTSIFLGTDRLQEYDSFSGSHSGDEHSLEFAFPLVFPPKSMVDRLTFYFLTDSGIVEAVEGQDWWVETEEFVVSSTSNKPLYKKQNIRAVVPKVDEEFSIYFFAEVSGLAVDYQHRPSVIGFDPDVFPKGVEKYSICIATVEPLIGLASPGMAKRDDGGWDVLEMDVLGDTSQFTREQGVGTCPVPGEMPGATVMTEALFYAQVEFRELEEPTFLFFTERTEQMGDLIKISYWDKQ